jgi:hypothetical protein
MSVWRFSLCSVGVSTAIVVASLGATHAAAWTAPTLRPSVAHLDQRHRRIVIPTQARDQPALNVSKIILAEPAVETPFPIQVGPLESIQRNSFIRIRGLPATAALTEGHAVGPGAWAIPIIALPNLKITVPANQSGKSDVTVALVTVDGIVIAETSTSLIVAAASLIAPGDPIPQARSVASLGPASGPPLLPHARDTLSTGVPNERPAALTDEQKRALALVAKGNEMLGLGNIAAARLFFERAAETGLDRAALALAATYDPVELGQLGTLGVQADTKLARKWYERAHQLGAAEAEERLRRLGAR